MDVQHSKAEPLGRRSPSKVNRSVLAPDILDRTNPFARILDFAADAIIAVSVRKSIVFFNRGAEAAFGYSAEEVRAKPLKLLFRGGLAGFHPERIAMLETPGEKAWATVRASGKSWAAARMEACFQPKYRYPRLNSKARPS